MLCIDHIETLRDKFGKMTVPEAQGHGIKSIAMVGAIPNGASATGMNKTDERHLSLALSILMEAGRHVERGFDVEVININNMFGGRDYMDPKDPTVFDLSVFCYVMRTFQDGMHQASLKHTGRNSSPHEAHNSKAWQEAALRRESKAIVTFGGEVVFLGKPTSAREVIAEDFTRKSFWKPWEKAAYKLVAEKPYYTEHNVYQDMPGYEYVCQQQLLLRSDCA